MNDDNLKVPMIPIDMNRKKQDIFREWISNSCMPFPDSMQSIPSSNTSLVSNQAGHDYILPCSHFLQEIRTKSRNAMWNGKFLLDHASSA